MRQANIKDATNLIYNKYWDISTGYLKLSVINELIQMFRVNQKILDPLMKVMLVIGKNLEKDSQNDPNDELGKDLTYVLLKIFDQTQVFDEQPETESIVRSSILNLVNLQNVYPSIAKEL